MKGMKLIIAICIVLVFAGVGLWGVSQRSGVGEPVQSGEAQIVLEEKGFTPSALRIRTGTKVTFTTTTGKFFWPASDLHPSHGIYPAFDPKKPLVATESWSFVFDRTGSWDFHDHLSPYYTGTITVSE